MPKTEPLELSIIIPTLNRLDALIECLDSVAARTRQVHHEVIVCANNCDRETQAYLDSVPTIRSIKSSDNLYFTRAVNQGIDLAEGRYVFLLNDDCVILRDDWFEFYRKLLETDPRIAIVGPYWKNIDELPFGWIEPYATLYRKKDFDTFGYFPYFGPDFILWWSDIYHAYRLMHQGMYIRPLAREVVDRFVHHKRVGESGETVIKMKQSLPEECFSFHGMKLMYRRLGVDSEVNLMGYYQGEVWNGTWKQVQENCSSL